VLLQRGRAGEENGAIENSDTRNERKKREETPEQIVLIFAPIVKVFLPRLAHTFVGPVSCLDL
jgi:hypothetical protein